MCVSKQVAKGCVSAREEGSDGRDTKNYLLKEHFPSVFGTSTKTACRLVAPT